MTTLPSSALLLVICYTTALVYAGSPPPKLLVVISTQEHAHHRNYARLSKSFIDSQTQSLKKQLTVEVIISLETWPDVSATWTFYPLFKEISDLYASDGVDWVLIIPEVTEVRLSALLPVLRRHDPTKPEFIGRALRDSKRSIIHHYADTGLLYPDSFSGLLISWSLLTLPGSPTGSFSIDPRHELAKHFFADGQGTTLTNATEFCSPETTPTESCATHYTVQSFVCPTSSTHKPVGEDDVFVMVKTGEVFHKTRVPLQKRLWTSKVKNMEICSEVEDRSIPTVKIDAPNTSRGHCAKFFAILRRAYKEKHINSKKWLVIVDDDTMMNITRLTKLLTCYSATSPMALGERYGYMPRAGGGSYDYITGGGGTVLNMAAVSAVVKSGFKCSNDAEADDMLLGMLLRALEIPVLHSPLFHQAPPSAYPPNYIEFQRNYSISFHKYETDPPEVIATEWLGLSPSEPDHTSRTEL